MKPGRGRKDDRESQQDSYALLALGLGFLSLAGTAFGLSFPLKDDATASSTLRIVAGALALCGGGLLWAWLSRYSQRVKGWIDDWREYDVKPLPVGDNLQKVVQEGRKAIGDAHPSVETLEQRLEENAKVLSVWGRNWSRGRSKFCGYILLYPLTEATAEGIMSGSIRSEREFGERPLAPTFEGARHIYVAMVLGIGVHGKSRVKGLLRAELYELLTKGRVEKIFARKGSKGGEKLMQEYHLKPLLPEHGEEGIWFIGAAALKIRLFSEQAQLVEPYGGSGGATAGDGQAPEGESTAKIRSSPWPERIERFKKLLGLDRDRKVRRKSSRSKK